MDSKKEKIKKISSLMDQVRMICNEEEIPYVFVAAVYDGAAGTGYHTEAGNGRGGSFSSKDYLVSGLTPGSMEIELADDRIREIVKVMNGFRTVPPDDVLPDMSAYFIGQSQVRKTAEGAGSYVSDEELDTAEPEEEDAER